MPLLAGTYNERKTSGKKRVHTPTLKKNTVAWLHDNTHDTALWHTLARVALALGFVNLAFVRDDDTVVCVRVVVARAVHAPVATVVADPELLVLADNPRHVHVDRVPRVGDPAVRVLLDLAVVDAEVDVGVAPAAVHELVAVDAEQAGGEGLEAGAGRALECGADASKSTRSNTLPMYSALIPLL